MAIETSDERALARRPFATLAAFKWALVQALDNATVDEQLALIRAHPELAGKAMVAQSLTAESTDEQTRAGLTQCTPEEFAQLQRLNADYNAKFGFPFILACAGHAAPAWASARSSPPSSPTRSSTAPAPPSSTSWRQSRARPRPT